MGKYQAIDLVILVYLGSYHAKAGAGHACRKPAREYDPRTGTVEGEMRNPVLDMVLGNGTGFP